MRTVIHVLLTMGLVLPVVSALAQQTGGTRVRECVGIEGIYGWFPGERGLLEKTVDKYLADAGDVPVEGKPVAVVAPHAGYRWSGATAAYAFKPLAGRSYRRVIVLAPSHHAGFQGGSIADVDEYGTPLGRIPLDKEACGRLLATDVIQSLARAHDQEHSLQNELPFLQRTLKDWKLVPIVLGAYQQDASIEKLTEAVKSVVTPETLIVVSSDFTHYGQRFSYVPFRTDLKENIRKLDQGAVDCICAGDAKGFADYIRRTQATICGRYPITVMLKVFEGRKDIRGKLVHYATSGDATGDYSNSVSYAAIVLSKVGEQPEAADDFKVIAEGEPEKPKTDDEVVEGDRLTEANQKLLLTIARAQLEKSIRDGSVIDPKEYGWDLKKKLLLDGAAFVTLKNRGRLRGCIGDIIARQPLYMSVIRNTVNAALYDYRFANDRITVRELPDIDIEISYLTPQKRVESYTEIEVGRHGVLLQKGARRAVFLPQVAPEQGWDRDTMLRNLSLKAGLAPDAWKEGCTFHVFEAQVFGEKELGRQAVK